MINAGSSEITIASALLGVGPLEYW